MGSDSVKPFLEFDNKWVILLALTSNEGAFDFQTIKTEKGNQLYEEVLEKSSKWGTSDNLMYVVGATKAEFFKEIRKIIPNHFLLVPGVGSQGGDLASLSKYGMNSSRGIIYASQGEDFADKAGQEAKSLQIQMGQLLDQFL